MMRVALVALLATLAACAEPTGTAPIVCTPGQSTTTMPWRQLPTPQLIAEVQRACGHVFIGFKEADAAYGEDEQGRSITSAETTARMKALLLERHVTFTEEFPNAPFIAGTMPIRPGLFIELRLHPNIDYIEPMFPGTRRPSGQR